MMWEIVDRKCLVFLSLQLLSAFLDPVLQPWLQARRRDHSLLERKMKLLLAAVLVSLLALCNSQTSTEIACVVILLFKMTWTCQLLLTGIVQISTSK